MPAWSPILVQKIEIHALGFVLRKLQLNRHRAAEVAPHRHGFTQLILYLSGEGVQRIAGRARAARTGDLFIIPRGTTHGFSPARQSRPLCLVLDYDRRTGVRRRRRAHRRLPPAALNELHALLARVPAKGRPVLSDYPAIIAVIARLLEAPPSAAPAAPPTLFEQMRALLTAPAHRDARLATLARAAGYEPDYLSRKLKREAGLGLRALRDRLRLEAAQTALRAKPAIADAAARAGFDDPNYFARWFKRQTGRPPGAWRDALP